MAGPAARNASVARPMPDLLASSFLIAAALAVVAGMVRGFAGFGAAMMMTPSYLLKTALPMPDARPLCQKPPSPMNEMERLEEGTLKAAALAAPRP